MDSTGSDDPAQELADLTRLFRAQIRRYAALGAWAAPGGESARREETAEMAEMAADVDVNEATVNVQRQREASTTTMPSTSTVASTSNVDDNVDGIVGEVANADAPLVPLGRRTLAQVREELGECTRCKLHTTRKNIVFGVGADDAVLMFVGEAPGEQEDRRGEPFVGAAGELLNKMIEAMGWTRQSVYIANTTKCRPPNNRNPQADELEQCTPFLDAQIRSIAPRIIVTLGRPAANHVLRNDAPISALRGRFHDRDGVKVMPTFHPAFLLRDPNRKKDTWSDLKQVIVELERLGIQPPNPPRG